MPNRATARPTAAVTIISKVIDRVVPTENVRAALATVESGNADAGIVYKTDARIAKRVRIAFADSRNWWAA